MNKLNNISKFQFVLILLLISTVAIIPEMPRSYAHASVEKSDPARAQSLSSSPTKVDIYLSDPIDIRYSQLKVLDSDGKEIQENDLHYINNNQYTMSVSLPAGLKDGLYTISTKVLDQTDGHVTEDAFVFAIGQPVPQNLTNLSNYQVVSIPEAIARFPALLGQVMVTGSVSATLWLWNPISRIFTLRNSTFETRVKIDVSMTRWITIGSNILLVSGFAMIIVQAYAINAGILDAISTKFGNMWLLRMIISSALFVLSYVMYYKMKKSPKVLPKRYLLTMLGLSFAVLATTSLIGHGAATGQVIPILLDFVHNVFASLWIGGVIYIAFVVMPHLKQITNSNLRISVISLLIPRFSTLVITVLGAVVITGPFLLYVLEGNLALTLASFYGKILIIKLSLAAAMISLGAYNQTAIYKTAYNTITDNKQNTTLPETVSIDASRILGKFNSSIKIEALVGMALIASVAILVDAGLPSSEFQNILQSLPDKAFALNANSNLINMQQFSQTRFIENGSRVVLSISPFSTGNNNFNISFLDSNKNPIDTKSVHLKLTQTDIGIGPITIDANQTSVGIFSINADFGFAGHWTVRVEGIQNKENALNLVASYDLFVKPQLSSLVTSINESKTPGNSSTPRYPVYDNIRNKIWVGDTKINGGKILEFDLETGKYVEHKIDGLNSVIYMALDSHDTLWYIDYQRKILGHYNPDNNSNQDYPIPSQGILTGIAIDNNDTVWITSTEITTHISELLKFNPSTAEFDSIKLPDKSSPQGIAIDNTSGRIWIAGGLGMVFSLDPSNNKIEEFAPTEKNYTLAGPTAIILDSQTGKIYISEHEGHAVSVFSPLLKTFERIPLDPNPDDLPYGMAFDKYHNLWVAQHTIDKIAIVDTRTKEYIEKNIPSSNSWIQWITSDSQGNIVIAEEKANALGIITISANAPSGNLQNNQLNIPVGIPQIGFSYAQIVAPSITGLLIVVAFFYSKAVLDLRNSSNKIRKVQTE